jgi:NADH-quinone oxidoreductase subunit N
MLNYSVPDINWLAILPMILVAGAGAVALVIEMFAPKKENSPIVAVCLIGLLMAGLMLFQSMTDGAAFTFADMVVQDHFGTIMQLIIVIGAFLAVLFSDSYLREKRIAFGEFYPLIMWSAVGAMVMSASTNLLMIFLGLEVLSIALYVLAGLSRSEEKSEESAMKYFLLGAFASSFFLYGIALTYGATGTLDLRNIDLAWTRGDSGVHALLVFGLAMLLIGLCFKAALVPFHQWTPDVYQGAPTNVTAYMAAGSKVGAFAVLARVLEASGASHEFWLPALSVVAILTMTVGNLGALMQKDVKRILGYSSISHAGYILVALLARQASPHPDGSTSTITYYLLSYTLMTVGAFAIVSLGAKKGTEETGLKALNGLSKRSPLAAISLGIFMFSLMGMPPTAGFFGKLFIFRDALSSGLTPLAIVLAINSVISVYYYLGITWAAFVGDEAETESTGFTLSPSVAGTCILCAAGVVAAAVFFAPLGALLK